VSRFLMRFNTRARLRFWLRSCDFTFFLLLFQLAVSGPKLLDRVLCEIGASVEDIDVVDLLVGVGCSCLSVVSAGLIARGGLISGAGGRWGLGKCGLKSGGSLGGGSGGGGRRRVARGSLHAAALAASPPAGPAKTAAPGEAGNEGGRTRKAARCKVGANAYRVRGKTRSNSSIAGMFDTISGMLSHSSCLRK